MGMKIPNEVIDDLRQQVRIEEVVGQYVQLIKRGQNYVASCPFHEDRNPSFSIHSQKQIYKCFSCGRGGNVFGFIQEIDQVSFPEAVMKVAEFADYALPNLPSSGADQELAHQDRVLYQIHQKVAEFYHYYLTGTTNGQEALDYLLDRQVQTETIDTFGLGYAPDQSNLVLAYLEGEAFSQEDLIRSGIFYQSEGSSQLVDRFRGRIIFPLKSQSGKVIAFSGRIFKSNDQRSGKYVNSPETAIFHKGGLLYNLDLARSAIRKTNQALVCEGYMDVIALYQAGFENVVATMGTSLTQAHLAYLTKLAGEVVWVFDGDEPGREASNRAFDLARQFPRTHFKSIAVPQQKDPDEWLRTKGAASFRQLLDQAQTLFNFKKDYLKSQYRLEDPKQKSEYIDQLLLLLNQKGSPIENQLYLAELAKEFDLEEALLKERLVRLSDQAPSRMPARSDQPVVVPSPAQVTGLPIRSHKAYQSEKLWLGQLMFQADAWQYIQSLQELPVLYHEFSQAAFSQLADYYYQGHALPLTGIVGNIADTQVNQVLTTVMWDYQPMAYDVQIMQDCQQMIRQAFSEQEIKELKERLKKEMAQQNQDQVQDLIQRIMNLERQLKVKK